MSTQSLGRKIKELVQAFKEFLTLPDRLHAYTKEFIEQGGKSIDTTHIYEAPDKTQHELHLRTSIQLDGDVINFFPDPDQFKDDPQWKEQLMGHVDTHYQQVKVFYKDLEAMQRLGTRITNMIGTMVGTISALFVDVGDEIRELLAPIWMPLAEIHPFLVNIFWFLVVSIVLGVASGVVFFYMLKPALFKLIMKSVKRKMGK